MFPQKNLARKGLKLLPHLRGSNELILEYVEDGTMSFIAFQSVIFLCLIIINPLSISQ